MDPDWLRDYAWAIWTGIAMLLGVAELISLDLILLMLAGGALVGALTALLQLGLPLQVLAAVATSVAMLAGGPPGPWRGTPSPRRGQGPTFARPAGRPPWCKRPPSSAPDTRLVRA